LGWGSDHWLGIKFAGRTETGVKPDHVILIARRHRGKPDVVGFGIVVGKSRTSLKGFTPPQGEAFGSARKLRRLKLCSKLPRAIRLVDVLPRNRALVELHPNKPENKFNVHRKVCAWMDQMLGISARPPLRHKNNDATTGTRLRPLRENPQFDYTVRTKSQIKRAQRIEDELVWRYRRWLESKGRQLVMVRCNKLWCDGYEKKKPRSNLIEAKSSTTREHIRMAIGQLLDYAFHIEKERGPCNKAILLPKRPSEEIEKWLQHIKISLIWRERGKFADNANGTFR